MGPSVFSYTWTPAPLARALAKGVLAAVRQEERLQQKVEGTPSLSRKQELMDTP